MRSLPLTLGLAVIGALLLTIGASVSGVSPVRVASAATCSPLPHDPGSFERTVVSGGFTRTYELHVPPSYDGTTPLPLVLSFHGLGSNISGEIFVSDLYPRADAQGLLIATPLGRSTSGLPQNHWNVTHTAPGVEADDVLFSTDMINDVATQVCVDVARVYSTGISNGGQMTSRLGCNLSNRIAAVAPVAGVFYPPLFVGSPDTCPDTRPMPIIAFHGTADTTIPYNGGPGALGLQFRDIDDVVMPAWASRNGCTTGPTTTLAAPGVNLLEWSGCTDGANAQLYAVFDYDGDGPNTAGGGHIWPGSPYTPANHSNEIEATDLMLAFFSQFTTPCAGGDGDCDAVLDGADNCVAVYNPGQNNNDRNFIDLPAKPYNDATVAQSDLVGDACDTDDDNDGLLDVDEATGATCGAVVTDHMLSDTDGDHALDGAECALGTDPLNVSAEPSLAACGPNTDVDGDKVLASREVCYYGTDPNVANSDGDTRNDGCEVYSVNGDLTVNVIDLQQVAQTSGGYASPGTPEQMDFDVTKNGAIDVIDLQQIAGADAVCP